jgi:MFS family permease
VNKISQIKTLSIYHAFARMIAMSMMFFYIAFLQDIGLSPWQQGLVLALEMLSSILIMLPSGFSNDKHKSKNLMILGMILLCLFYLGISLTTNFILVSILFAVGGLGSSIYSISANSLFYKLTEKQDLGKKIGFYQSLNYLFVAIGIILSGFLLNEEINFQKIFGIYAILQAVIIIIGAKILPSNSNNNFETLSYKKELWQPNIVLFMLILFLFGSQFGAAKAAYFPLLTDDLGLSENLAGYFIAIPIIIMAFASQMIGNLKNKFKEKLQVKFLGLGGMSMAAIGYLGLYFSNPSLVFIFRSINEIGTAIFFFFFHYAITKLFDLKKVGGSSSTFFFVKVLGTAAGAYLYPVIAENYGNQQTFIISGITLTIAAVLMTKYLKNFKHA